MAHYPLATVLAVAIPLGIFCFLAIVLGTVLSTRYHRYAKARKCFKSIASKQKQPHVLGTPGTPENQATILKDPNPSSSPLPTSNQYQHRPLSREELSPNTPRRMTQSTVSSLYSSSTVSEQLPYHNWDHEGVPSRKHRHKRSRHHTRQMSPASSRNVSEDPILHLRPENVVHIADPSLSPFNTESESSAPVLLPAIPITDHNRIGQHIYQKIAKRISDQEESDRQSSPEQHPSFGFDQDFDFEDDKSIKHTKPVWIKDRKQPKTPERKSPKPSKFKSLDHSVGNSPAGPLPNILPPKPPVKATPAYRTPPGTPSPFSYRSSPESQLPVFSFQDFSNANFGKIQTGGESINDLTKKSPLSENDGLIVNLHGTNIVADASYEASLSDELDIDVGDCLQIYEVFDDGWCKASIVLSVKPIETKRIIHGVCPMASLDLRPTPFRKKS